MSTRVCERCGEQNRTDATFCVACGARIGGGTCQCGITHPPGAAFCPNCGNPIEDAAAPEMGRRAQRRTDAGTRWVRGEHEIAARITPADLKGSLTSGLEVQHGTRALLFLGGRYVGTLPPGRHTIETTWQKLKLPSDGEPVAVVVDDGELDVGFSAAGLHTADHHEASIRFEASIRLMEPELFLANQFRDRATYTLAELTEFMEGEIRQGLTEVVAGLNAQDLNSGRARGRMEMELLARWRHTLERSGFVLNRFRVLQAEIPDLEVAEGIHAQAAGATVMLAAERAERGAFVEADLADFQLDTEFARKRAAAEQERRAVDISAELESMKQEVSRLQQRQPIFERLLQDGVLARMTELKSEEEWRVFQQQVDRERLIADAEWEALRKDTQAKAAQAETQRAFVSKRLVAQAQADLEELKVKQEYQLRLLQIRGDSDQLEEQVKQQRLELEAQLQRREKEFSQALSERERWFTSQRDQQKSMTDLQLYRVERLEAIRQMAKDKEAARQLQDKVTSAQIERDRLTKENEAFVMMSTDQILATAVARHPEKATEIAEAFRASKSGEATARERELYERMLSEVKGAYQRGQELDHGKFIASVEADARHRASVEGLHERDKDRIVSQAEWAYCEIHGIRHHSDVGCPLCGK